MFLVVGHQVCTQCVLGHCHAGIPIHDPFSMPWPCWYMAPSLMRCSCPLPLAEKHPQSIMFPPPCVTVGMVFLGSQAAFLLLQTRRVELMPKSWILVSSDHNTFTQFSSESLADFRRAVHMYSVLAQYGCPRIIQVDAAHWWWMRR